MECYNCGAPLTADNFCPKCGADVKIYKKIIVTSNRYYNEGLEQARVRNLSGATESLKKSLQLNKMNTDARNLLGLVYFEMGETVSALSEWVISKNYQSKDNAAGRYLNEIQNNSSRLETINQTIKKYNQALYYCKQDSKDLATLQLKKVLSLNPKLVKGHQLLALLYMQEGKYEQAKKALNNAAKIDENNMLTLRYMKEVNGMLKEESPKKQKKEDLISYKSGNDTIIMPANFKDNSATQTVINIVIGVAIGIAIMIFLLLPNIKQQAKSDANEALKAANDTISTKEQSISSLENKVKDLTKETDEAKEQAKKADSRLVSYEKLIEAYFAYGNNDVDAAGAALGEVKEKDLNGTAKDIYKDVNARVNEKYMASMYQEGYNSYNRGDYNTAIEKLGKVAELDETYQRGNTVYYLAQSYRKTDNTEQALVYYKKVLEQVPNTERGRVAKNFIQENEGADADENTNANAGTNGNTNTNRNTGTNRNANTNANVNANANPETGENPNANADGNADNTIE